MQEYYVYLSLCVSVHSSGLNHKDNADAAMLQWS